MIWRFSVKVNNLVNICASWLRVVDLVSKDLQSVITNSNCLSLKIPIKLSKFEVTLASQRRY